MNRIRQFSTTEKEGWRELSPRAASGTADLKISDKTDQLWRGFGGCFNELGWTAIKKLTGSKQQKLLHDLFAPDGECRFTFCRLPVGASDYALNWYSHNEKEGDFGMKRFSIERDHLALIPYIKAAKAHNPNLELVASPWSPPTWMKSPAVYNSGTFRMEERYLQAYALYLLRFVMAYEEQGLPIRQIHVQNEPVSSQKFPSCVWSGDAMRIFIRDYLGPLFAKKAVNTEIWFGTINGPETDNRFLSTGFNDYANLALEDAKTRRYIKGVSYQWAGKYAIQRTRQAWPEVPLMQSENECGDGNNRWNYAQYVFDLFYHYITNGVESYLYWNMVLEPKGLSTWGWAQNSMVTILPEQDRVIQNPEYFVMRHFSQFIKPGDKRLQVEGHWSGNTVGFTGKGGTILVIRNPFPQKKTITIDEAGLKWSCMLPPDSFNTILIK